jgi:ligand-binding sensor domain-containing protein
MIKSRYLNISLLSILKYKCLITILFYLCLSGIVSAQDYPVTFLDISNGLSNNSVTTIYQDNDGYMWFGTYDGLNRYDGYTFKVYRSRINDKTSLVSNTVYCIEGDKKNNIWIGGTKGACVLDKSKAVFHPVEHKLPGNSKTEKLTDIVHQIKAVSGTLVLMASQNSGLLTFENGAFTGNHVALDGLNNKKSRYNYDAVVLENDIAGGGCWVYVKNAGICRYTYTSKKLRLVFPSSMEVRCMKTSADGNLLLGTDEGLYLYNTISGSLSANYFS